MMIIIVVVVVRYFLDGGGEKLRRVRKREREKAKLDSLSNDTCVDMGNGHTF